MLLLLLLRLLLLLLLLLLLMLLLLMLLMMPVGWVVTDRRHIFKPGAAALPVQLTPIVENGPRVEAWGADRVIGSN